jgi:butyrate kinase
MEALALGALRVLRGEEKAKKYVPPAVLKPFE